MKTWIVLLTLFVSASALAEQESVVLDDPLYFARTKEPLWPITRAWSVEEERLYAEWVAREARTGYLSGTGIRVDCADFAVVLRWIYARERGLPAANHLAGSRRLFGSWESTAEWDQLPRHSDWRRDERFKAALDYLQRRIYTHSMPDDLYPVSITRDWMIPGTVYLTLSGATGHARTLIDTSTALRVIWGNEPARETVYIDELIPLAVPRGQGFTRFRWPEQTEKGWALRQPELMPGYSTEQHDWPATDYLLNISRRLGLWNTVEDRYVQIGKSLVGTLKSRFEITAQGYFLCAIIPCSEDETLYDHWSTPSRDRRLREEIASFQSLTKGVNRRETKVRDFEAWAAMPVFPGAPYSALDVINGKKAETFSPDPRADLFARWGTRSPDRISQMRAWTEAAHATWLAREKLVAEGEETSRLDEAFRLLQVEFAAGYGMLSRDHRNWISYSLEIARTNVNHCSWREDGVCRMKDYILERPELLTRMSSNPADAPSARFGFP